MVESQKILLPNYHLSPYKLKDGPEARFELVAAPANYRVNALRSFQAVTYKAT